VQSSLTTVPGGALPRHAADEKRTQALQVLRSLGGPAHRLDELAEAIRSGRIREVLADPERSATGRGLVLTGVVRSAAGCAPLAGATLEWWSADPSGRYDAAHRATQRAAGAGRYRYETSFPGLYPGRPAHLHVRVSAPGHRVLVTQVYPARGQTAFAQDFVLVAE